MTEILSEVMSGRSLTSAQAESLMDDVIERRASPVQVGALLTAFQFRAPLAQEIAGFARAFRRRTVAVETDGRDLVDVCGTGGDGQGTFNISTTVAFVVASLGQPIAKHGNRAVSSRCGSFDVLEQLGVPFIENAPAAKAALLNYGLAFLYAPAFQPAFRELAPIRKALGVRTVLNVLGPLLNPTNVRRQLIGVYARSLVAPVAEALAELGMTDAMVVHGDDGGDEISLCAPTTIARLQAGHVTISRLTPEDLGFRRTSPAEISGGSAVRNAEILKDILAGQRGSARDAVAINVAGALMVAGRVESMREGVEQAEKCLDAGKALNLLERMTQSVPKGALA